jgi:hypothetical protein
MPTNIPVDRGTICALQVCQKYERTASFNLCNDSGTPLNVRTSYLRMSCGHLFVPLEANTMQPKQLSRRSTYLEYVLATFLLT